jgi:hypothetical protein
MRHGVALGIAVGVAVLATVGFVLRRRAPSDALAVSDQWLRQHRGAASDDMNR